MHTITSMIAKRHIVFDDKRGCYKTGPKHMVAWRNERPLAEFFAVNLQTGKWDVLDADGDKVVYGVADNSPVFDVMKAI